jgi:hypothetical protein
VVVVAEEKEEEEEEEEVKLAIWVSACWMAETGGRVW